MKLKANCLLFVVLCLAVDLSSAQYNNWNRNSNYLGSNRNSNFNLNGFNHQSNNGRHNTNVNWRGVNYNYKGNRWNTNVNHNWIRHQTNVDANYRRNHNFGAGYNWQNRQVNVGYKWTFGKRRRATDIQDEMMEFLKMEIEPKVFLKKLQFAVNEFVKTFQTTVPELEILSVSVPDDQITNVTVAQETVCVVRKLQRILPKKLGNFIVKMIKFHGPSFDIKDLGDFFSVDPAGKIEIEDNHFEDNCVIPEVAASSELLDGRKLYDMKKFVATLITVAMEYQQMLE